jgi:hypothetical protein
MPIRPLASPPLSAAAHPSGDETFSYARDGLRNLFSQML